MVGLVFLAVVFALVALLYAMGTISFMTTHPGAAHHYQHAAVLAVLTVAALVGASLVRPRTV
jgi:hypothetical protein